MTITPETTERILEAAWNLIVEEGRLDIAMTDIAKAAGVSRQSLHLAFGGRTGILIAVARRADRISGASDRMRAAISAKDDGAVSLGDFLRAWFEHVPEIYPVGVLLASARETDASARAAWDDRMNSLLAGLTAILTRAEKAGRLRSGLKADKAAELAWSLAHFDAWRCLVIERSWPQEKFADDRIELIENLLFVNAEKKASR